MIRDITSLTSPQQLREIVDLLHVKPLKTEMRQFWKGKTSVLKGKVTGHRQFSTVVLRSIVGYYIVHVQYSVVLAIVRHGKKRFMINFIRP